MDSLLMMIENGTPAQEILNRAVKEHALDNRYVHKLQISSQI